MMEILTGIYYFGVVFLVLVEEGFYVQRVLNLPFGVYLFGLEVY